MYNISVLLTCHNRKEKTIKCLKHLFSQQDLDINFNLSVFLVDDGSIDGTSEAVSSHFPSVKIIKGKGDLFWNRGMYLAWKTALNEVKSNYFLWLNDDTFLKINAVKTLLNDITAESIICGVTISEINGGITYGGFLHRNKKLMLPNGSIQRCDYFNGNCVLIPASVVDKIGINDPYYHHALGDFDFSLRAKKKGIENFISSESIGFCELHEYMPAWLNSEFSLMRRIRYLYTPQSGCDPREYFYFDLKHSGIFIGILHFITIHARLIFPDLYFRFFIDR
jgi:GT2 family glycosyltransferase